MSRSPIYGFFFIFQLLLFGAVCSCFGQSVKRVENYRIRHLGVEDGLSQGSVYSMLKDSEGFMWMTSYEGLNRFDGRNFITFTDNPNDSNSINGNNTIGIVQDPYGFIWVGTEKCLNRYDPKTSAFVGVWVEGSDGEIISSRHYPFYADSLHIYYINEDEGIVKWSFINQEKTYINKRIRFRFNELNYNPAFKDALGRIWVRNAIGLCIISEQDQRERYFFSNQSENEFGDPKVIYTIKPMNEEDYLISTKDGIIVFNPDSQKAELLITTQQIGDEVYDVEVVDEDLLWLGTDDQGLVCYSLSQRKFIEHFHTQTSVIDRLLGQNTSYLYADEDGMLWVGCDPNGVSMLFLNNQPFQAHHSFFWNNQEYSLNGVRCFAENAAGLIYIGTQENGILLYDPQTEQVIDRIPMKVFPFNYAVDLHIDGSENLWIATHEGLYRYHPTTNSIKKIDLQFTFNLYTSKKSAKKGKSPLVINPQNIYSLEGDFSRNIYVSTEFGLFIVEEADDKISHISIAGIGNVAISYMDEFNNLFASNIFDGFYVTNADSMKEREKGIYTSDEVRHYLHHSVQVKSFHYSEMTKSHWICTSNGLYNFSIDSISLDRSIIGYYGKEDGLKSTYMYGCLEDDSGNLWLSSNRGIHRLQPKSGQIHQFGPSNGLHGYEFNTNAFLKTRKGEFYFGGVSGFTKFDPLKIKLNQIPPPQPIITSLIVNDEKINRLQSVSDLQPFFYSENTLTFSFLSTDYQSVGPNTYRYRLKNFDDSWVEQNKIREARFVNLPSGKYTFEVQVANDNMIWNENTTRLSIEIQPPWWRRWWFIVLACTSLFLVALYAIWQRISNIKHREQTNRRLAELQLSALQSQMNPHFVFNCMNTIDGFIATNDRRKASDFIASFSKLIRKSLELSRSRLILVEKEVEFVKTYIALEKQRFEKPFDVNIDIHHPEEMRRRKIPPMTIQPIVENAIWHGIVPLKGGGILNVSDGFIGSQYFICIADNGRGIKPNTISNQRGSLGIKIVQERFDLINLSNSDIFRLEDRSDESEKGTKICIFIPTPKS